MTVQKNLVKNIYVGNGNTTQFPITFDVNTEHPEYIHVYLTNDDNITTETENFTVNLTAKTVTYPKEGQPLATGKKLVIMRELPLMQLMDLINQGDYYADDVEQAFDDLTMIAQQLSEKLARAMVFSVEVDTANFSNIIPLAPGMSFRINDEGTGLELTEDPAKVLPQAKNLLQQTTEQAKIATNKANAAADSALAAATSESNAGAHEDKAQAWAESETSPDGKPDSKSAKTWAGDSADSAEMAQKWAESDESPDGETDSESPTSETMSAKEWALYAKQLAQQIGNPVVSVTESNGKITVETADGHESEIEITLSDFGIDATAAELNETIGAKDNLQNQIDNLEFLITNFPAWWLNRGNGSDGAFNPASNTTISSTKNFTSVNIPSGVTVTVAHGARLLCTGAFTNAGTIQVQAVNMAGAGGAGGYDGGAGPVKGASNTNDTVIALGGNGGAGARGYNGTANAAGGAAVGTVKRVVTDESIITTPGGSGAGGGGGGYHGGSGGSQTASGGKGGNGGAGGGSMLITCATFNNTGTIKANGANGNAGSGTMGGGDGGGSGGGGGGGGGAGGAILVVADTVTAQGTITATGGAAGAGGSNWATGASGAKGADGVVHVVAINQSKGG